MQYSSLKQNHKEQRKQARAGLVLQSARAARPRFAFSPLVVDRVMYVVGGGGAIVALDGNQRENRSGRIRWKAHRLIGDSITGRARTGLTEGSFLQSTATCRK